MTVRRRLAAGPPAAASGYWLCTVAFMFHPTPRLQFVGRPRVVRKSMPAGNATCRAMGPRLPQTTPARAGGPFSTPARPRLQPGRPGLTSPSRGQAAQTLGSASGVL